MKFDLDDTPVHLRPKVWANTLNEFFYNYEFIIPDDFRSGQIKGCNAGELTIAGIESDAMSVRRASSHIANDPLDAYFVLLAGGSPISLKQRGRDAEVENKLYSLVSTADEYDYIQNSHTKFSNLIIPGKLLRQFAPNVDDYIATKLGHTAVEKVFFDFANSLCMECDQIDMQARDLMARQLVEMLGLILDGADVSSQAGPILLAHYRRINSFIESHFAYAGLDTDFIAKHLNLSKRYVQAIVSSRNTTIQNMIKKRRIIEAKKLLSQRKTSRLSIASICYMAGFSSHSHFSREFKVETGICPSNYECFAGSTSV